MPVPLTYPGVYVEEIPSGVRTIVGVSTSTTAFVGRTLKGPVRVPTIIHSFGEFERIYGGLWADSPLTFAVQQYFANGGSEAVIVRAFNGVVGPSTAKWTIAAQAPDPGNLSLMASGPGEWANTLRVSSNRATTNPLDTKLFNLVVTDISTNPPTLLETIRNVTITQNSTAFVTKILEQQSQYLRVDPSGTVPISVSIATNVVPTNGSNGNPLVNADILGTEPARTGIYALLDTDIFNLLCLPPPSLTEAVSIATYTDAATFCKKRRAMLIVDAPADNVATVKTTGPALVTGDGRRNAALFYPRIRVANPLSSTGVIDEYVPCGAVAGVFARTDAQRGVWKAPAGIEAGLAGVQGLSVSLTDDDNGGLNPLGINCLRIFPLVNAVVWGSRTMDGADALASEWKYVPVRRTALFIEESLFRGLKWVVFEPNAAPLWAQIRLNVGAFMQNLFKQGAFQGTTPREAYFVKVDSETTTQTDINLGIVNILVGFAPLKPAEFVVIKIQQMAGQIQT